MDYEQEFSTIPNDLSLKYEKQYDGFLLDSLFKINYQKSLFLDEILIQKKLNNSKTDTNLCTTKRYSPQNMKYKNAKTENNYQYQNDLKESITILNNKVDDKIFEKKDSYQNFINGNFNIENSNKKRQTVNIASSFSPRCYINVDKKKNCKVYDCLFKITGAHLTQNEIIFLRKTVFRKVLPPIRRDEIRNKMSNIKCLDKYSDKIMSLLKIPSVQLMIRDYVFSRRRNFEKDEMIFNLHQNIISNT